MTTEEPKLEVVTRAAGAMEVRPDPTPGDMLKAVIDKGISGLDVGVVEKLMALYERQEDRKAEKDFAGAFVKLQADMPSVQATRPVPGRDGGIRYKFAPLEDLMKQVGPLLQRHGFTVSFSNRYDEKRLIETCTLQHVSGHKRCNDFAVRIGSGPPGCTETQGDGAAATYAKRFALCDALNIVIAHLDNDAAAEGGPITNEQAKDLESRVISGGVDRVAFLKFAQSKSFSEIASTKFSIVDEQLRRMCVKTPAVKESLTADPIKSLKKKLWDICRPIRGSDSTWVYTEAQLTLWKILPIGVKIADLKVDDLLQVIDKTSIAMEQIK